MPRRVGGRRKSNGGNGGNFILTQRRRGRRVLFEHGLNGLNGLILFLEFTNDVFNDVQITEGVKECGWIVQ